ncbi:MAG: hypothetical protein A2622_14165 [Bdellovibrionales bacterium RIFCSPHIGHO2_01_FULL_40_29]|nr:MAG: hypothetical protein A2622_14165 [Bdellovibrionales bacterium RIFCSPHIGHO2_01_FULL_40_29]OFZ33666.1 MAG: hypothetical protein A3D17_11775 [Bdellovibrionales bacterium RIFCSPHIGHO2_02_FULL_40_15]
MSQEIIEKVNTSRLSLYQQLFIYGDFIPLNFKIDTDLFLNEIKQFDNDWVVYNKHKGDTGRMGLSVTSLDGGLSGEPDLQSLYEFSQRTGKVYSENDFCRPTEVFKKVTAIQNILTTFEDGLGRCRIVKFSAGGFFPPHRDQSIKYQVPDYFRIFIALNNCGENDLYFIYDDKKIKYEVGRAYLFNALKPHSVFSFTKDAYTFAISLQLNQKNIQKAIQSFLVK